MPLSLWTSPKLASKYCCYPVGIFSSSQLEVGLVQRWANRCATPCVSTPDIDLFRPRIDSLTVQVKPNFLVYCVGILARQRWGDISSISMITRVSQLLDFPLALTSSSFSSFSGNLSCFFLAIPKMHWSAQRTFSNLRPRHSRQTFHTLC